MMRTILFITIYLLAQAVSDETEGNLFEIRTKGRLTFIKIILRVKLPSYFAIVSIQLFRVQRRLFWSVLLQLLSM